MNSNKVETPFFARFLEGQDFPKVKTNVKGGEDPTPTTLKYPSDTDEPRDGAGGK
jgi:hypothetical protein